LPISSGKEEVIKKIEGFLKSRGEIVFAYLFGSFAEEEIFNDLDVGIYVDENSNLARGIFYEIELSNELEEIIRIPVDIIVLNKASHLMVHRASKGVLIKNEDDNVRADIITKHWRIYWDFQSKIQEHVLEMKHGSR